MGSLRFEGILFAIYSHDHWPPHVHAFYAGVQVILDLKEDISEIEVAERKDSIQPSNAKRSDIRKIVRCAQENGDALLVLWKEIHG